MGNQEWEGWMGAVLCAAGGCQERKQICLLLSCRKWRVVVLQDKGLEEGVLQDVGLQRKVRAAAVKMEGNLLNRSPAGGRRWGVLHVGHAQKEERGPWCRDGVQVIWGVGGCILSVRLDKYSELKVILQDTRSGMTVTKGCTNFCAVLVWERGSCLAIQSCGAQCLLVWKISFLLLVVFVSHRSSFLWDVGSQVFEITLT